MPFQHRVIVPLFLAMLTACEIPPIPEGIHGSVPSVKWALRPLFEGHGCPPNTFGESISCTFRGFSNHMVFFDHQSGEQISGSFPGGALGGGGSETTEKIWSCGDTDVVSWTIRKRYSIIVDRVRYWQDFEVLFVVRNDLILFFSSDRKAVRQFLQSETMKASLPSDCEALADPPLSLFQERYPDVEILDRILRIVAYGGTCHAVSRYVDTGKIRCTERSDEIEGNFPVLRDASSPDIVIDRKSVQTGATWMGWCSVLPIDDHTTEVSEDHSGAVFVFRDHRLENIRHSFSKVPAGTPPAVPQETKPTNEPPESPK